MEPSASDGWGSTENRTIQTPVRTVLMSVIGLFRLLSTGIVLAGLVAGASKAGRLKLILLRRAHRPHVKGNP